MDTKYLDFPRVVLSLALASVYATTITAILFLTNTFSQEVSLKVGVLLFLAAIIELLVIVLHQDEIKARTKKDDGVVSIIFSAIPGGVGAALLAAFISQHLNVDPTGVFMGILVPQYHHAPSLHDAHHLMGNRLTIASRTVWRFSLSPPLC